jgi:hypothetical protein
LYIGFYLSFHKTKNKQGKLMEMEKMIKRRKAKRKKHKENITTERERK